MPRDALWGCRGTHDSDGSRDLLPEPKVVVQRDSCNNRYTQVWCWRLTVEHQGGHHAIEAELAHLCLGMRILRLIWVEQRGETSCLVAALPPDHRPKAAYGKRYGKLGASDRDKLLAVYQSQGIQACYAAFPSHSHSSLAGVLNHLGMGIDGKRRRPRREDS